MTAPRPEPDVWIVGLGIRGIDHVTKETERVLRSVREVLYVDTGVATQAYLESLCERVTPLFGKSYGEDEHRLGAYRDMAAATIEAAMDHPPVAFAMQGHAVVGAYAPALIADAARLLGLEVRALAAVSAMDVMFAELLLDPCLNGLQMYEATDLLLRRRPLQPDVPALIWQIGSLETRLHTTRHSRPARFARFLSHLRGFYPEDHPVAAVFASPHPLMQSTVLRFALGQIGAHARSLHHGFTLYLPARHARPIEDAELARLVDSAEHLRRITG